MALAEYAEREMKLAGLYDEDADYDGMIPKAVMELVKTFSEQGHSGMSAHLVTEIFNKLARYENLTPLTSNPDEWTNVSEATGSPLWQSKRRPDAFSKDGGETWYFLDGEK